MQAMWFWRFRDDASSSAVATKNKICLLFAATCYVTKCIPFYFFRNSCRIFSAALVTLTLCDHKFPKRVFLLCTDRGRRSTVRSHLSQSHNPQATRNWVRDRERQLATSRSEKSLTHVADYTSPKRRTWTKQNQLNCRRATQKTK